jgi:hypothetical protein
MGGGARAPFGVAMNPKRRVRAAHGRARAAKTFKLFFYLFITNFSTFLKEAVTPECDEILFVKTVKNRH